MRKKNLNKALESITAPNPKEVDIWVEPKDDDTVSLKYYDYHEDQWVGAEGSNGDNSDVEEALLYFKDGTAYSYYYYPKSGKVVQLDRDNEYVNTYFAIEEEYDGFVYNTIYVATPLSNDLFYNVELLRTHLNNGYPVILSNGVISCVRQLTSDIVIPINYGGRASNILDIEIAPVPGYPSDEDITSQTYYMSIAIK